MYDNAAQAKDIVRIFYFVTGVIILFVGFFFALFSVKAPGSEPLEFELTEQHVVTDSLKGGWHQATFLPADYHILAGYRKRPRYEIVLDTPTITTIWLEGSSQKFAIISVDLLLFPPLLKEMLESKYGDEVAFYFAASHTHHGVGGWEKTPAGEVISGEYNGMITNLLYEKIEQSLGLAAAKSKNIYHAFSQIPVPAHIRNKLSNKPSEDRLFIQSFATATDTLDWLVYAAHPTSIHAQKPYLSNDYPAWVTRSYQELTLRNAFFSAGAVGGLQTTKSGSSYPEHQKEIGNELSLSAASSIANADYQLLKKAAFRQYTFSDITPSLRLKQGLFLRPYVFRYLFDELKGSVRFINLNQYIMAGMPADYSGEFSIEYPNHVMVTSFNGDYCGYLSPEHYYFTSTKAEIVSLNWVPRGTAEKFDSLTKNVIRKLSL